MKPHLKVISFVVVVVLSLWLALPVPAPAPKPETSIEKLCHDHFETGILTGWVAAQYGATADDIRYLADCFKRGDLNAYNRWMREHGAPRSQPSTL